jgi:hypothetical protein
MFAPLRDKAAVGMVVHKEPPISLAKFAKDSGCTSKLAYSFELNEFFSLKLSVFNETID